MAEIGWGQLFDSPWLSLGVFLSTLVLTLSGDSMRSQDSQHRSFRSFFVFVHQASEITQIVFLPSLSEMCPDNPRDFIWQDSRIVRQAIEVPYNAVCFIFEQAGLAAQQPIPMSLGHDYAWLFWDFRCPMAKYETWSMLGTGVDRDKETRKHQTESKWSTQLLSGFIWCLFHQLQTPKRAAAICDGKLSNNDAGGIVLIHVLSSPGHPDTQNHPFRLCSIIVHRISGISQMFIASDFFITKLSHPTGIGHCDACRLCICTCPVGRSIDLFRDAVF